MALYHGLAAWVLFMSVVYWSSAPSEGSEFCDGLYCEHSGRCYNNTCICFDGWTAADCNTTVTCGRFPLDHSVIILEEEGDYTGAYDEIITYTCMEGYQFEDTEGGSSENTMEKTARCNEAGEWQPVDVPCLAVCPAIPTWRGYLADTSRRLAGTAIRYICYGRYAWYEPNEDNLKFKYRFADRKEGDESEMITTCMENATWWPPILDCQEISSENDNFVSPSSGVRNKAALSVLLLLILVNII